MSDLPPPANPPGSAPPPGPSPNPSPGPPPPGSPVPPGPPPQGWGHPPAETAPYPGQPWYPGPVGWYPPGPGGYPLGPGGYPSGTGWYPPGFDPADPLVTPPGAGLPGWYDRCVGAVRRGWRVLLPILLITQVLPGIVMSVIALGLDPSARWEASSAQDPNALPDTFASDLALLLLTTVGGAVLVGLVQCLGWAGATWAITRQAVGEPVTVTAALRYGLSRAVGLWGWSLAIGVFVAVGLCFCLVPGIYLGFALSLAGPIYLFERVNPIGRAFRMFHQRFGMVLGRVALVGGVMIAGAFVLGMLEAAATLPFGTDPYAEPATAVGAVAVLTFTGLLGLPLQIVPVAGLVVTYAEQRAQEGPVSSAGLAAELR